MSDNHEAFPLPDGLPEPEDDGEADHLPGTTVPEVPLRATDGTTIEFAALTGRCVVYCYPKTGRPGEDLLPDGWNEIPGARGCTPEACSFRDHYRELKERGISDVYGLSLQSRGYQREARDRLGLPFELVSDHDLAFTTRLDLPTFEIAAETFLKRLTLIITDGQIEQVFYPVFPPDEHPENVRRWLDAHPLD